MKSRVRQAHRALRLAQQAVHLDEQGYIAISCWEAKALNEMGQAMVETAAAGTVEGVR